MKFSTRLWMGIRRLGPVNRVVFWLSVGGVALASSLGILDYLYFRSSVTQEEVSNVIESERTRKRWERLPLTDITVGFDVTNSELFSSERPVNRFPTLEISLDRKPFVSVPGPVVEKYRNDLEVEVAWDQPCQIKTSIATHLQEFPSTIGELIGHELKVRENDPRPLLTFSRICLYHRFKAVNPFLILSERAHEYAGGAYLRTWYPDGVEISSDGDMRDHAPFVINEDLFDGRFVY